MEHHPWSLGAMASSFLMVPYCHRYPGFVPPVWCLGFGGLFAMCSYAIKEEPDTGASIATGNLF